MLRLFPLPMVLLAWMSFLALGTEFEKKSEGLVLHVTVQDAVTIGPIRVGEATRIVMAFRNVSEHRIVLPFLPGNNPFSAFWFERPDPDNWTGYPGGCGEVYGDPELVALMPGQEIRIVGNPTPALSGPGILAMEFVGGKTVFMQTMLSRKTGEGLTESWPQRVEREVPDLWQGSIHIRVPIKVQSIDLESSIALSRLQKGSLLENVKLLELMSNSPNEGNASIIAAYARDLAVDDPLKFRCVSSLACMLSHGIGMAQLPYLTEEAQNTKNQKPLRKLLIEFLSTLLTNPRLEYCAAANFVQFNLGKEIQDTIKGAIEKISHDADPELAAMARSALKE